MVYKTQINKGTRKRRDCELAYLMRNYFTQKRGKGGGGGGRGLRDHIHTLRKVGACLEKPVFIGLLCCCMKS